MGLKESIRKWYCLSGKRCHNATSTGDFVPGYYVVVSFRHRCLTVTMPTTAPSSLQSVTQILPFRHRCLTVTMPTTAPSSLQSVTQTLPFR
ncbi:MAG: hypothetical protein MJZ72_05215 [Bacteroidales bacterium]|nr:hypothetical protein [Bacteroidales bacterium]